MRTDGVVEGPEVGGSDMIIMTGLYLELLVAVPEPNVMSVIVWLRKLCIEEILSLNQMKHTKYNLSMSLTQESANFHNHEQVTNDDSSTQSLSQPSPSTLNPLYDPPLTSIPPLTPRNLLRSDTSSPLPFSPEKHLEEDSEAETPPSKLKQKTGSDWLTGTERDSERDIGLEWLVGTESGSERDIGSEWLVGTESDSSAVEEPKMTVGQIRDLLARNRLYVKDPDATRRGKTVVTKATDIMDERRNSHMSSTTANDIVETMEIYSTQNEKTMLVNLWQLLVNKTRFSKKIKANGEQEVLTLAEEEEAAVWIEKAWLKDDYLFAKWDAEFFANTIPEIATTGDAAEDLLLEEVPRVAKPKPDIAMGFLKQAFSSRVLEVLEKFDCKLTNGQFISFFEVEAKGADKPIAEAENQCCRGGAAMVKNCRDFYKASKAYLNPAQGASSDTYPRPDLTSIAFSLALTPQFAIMFVHWAEETNKDAKTHKETEVWQQTQLRSYRLDVLDDIKQLHFNIDNILEWGCGTRRQKIVERCEKVAEHIIRLSSAEKRTADKAVKDALESPAVKRQKSKHEVGE
ncbi:MAG: hypothetical protein Q9166_006991 [cf. Caloplaca sp. 2 TL-2023]